MLESSWPVSPEEAVSSRGRPCLKSKVENETRIQHQYLASTHLHRCLCNCTHIYTSGTCRHIHAHVHASYTYMHICTLHNTFSHAYTTHMYTTHIHAHRHAYMYPRCVYKR